MSSSICPYFTQNAWKKDLCSNCFKSKSEHKYTGSTSGIGKSYSSSLNMINHTNNLIFTTAVENKDTLFKSRLKVPTKSIIKKKTGSRKDKNQKVCFPNNVSEIIGYGGDWSEDNDSPDDDESNDFMTLISDCDESADVSTDDEQTLEMKRITQSNTDFNMNNGNLLGDPQENIKKSFAALRLGAPLVDKEGKKQTLKINVVPFGSSASSTKDQNFQLSAMKMTKRIHSETTDVTTSTMMTELSPTNIASSLTRSTEGESIKISNNTSIATTTTTTIINSLSESQQRHLIDTKIQKPKIVTTEVNKAPVAKVTVPQSKNKINSSLQNDGKISPPIERAMGKSLLDEISETLELQQSKSRKPTEEDAIAGTASVSTKIKFEITSLAESLESKKSFEFRKPIVRNTPITKDHTKPNMHTFQKFSENKNATADSVVTSGYDLEEGQLDSEGYTNEKAKSLYKQKQYLKDKNVCDITDTSSRYITDRQSVSYKLHEGNFMTTKLTSDGLIMTKCTSSETFDSTGYSTDDSSDDDDDEETSYNVTRSESDSGIGSGSLLSTNDGKHLNFMAENNKETIDKKLKINKTILKKSDYENEMVVASDITSNLKNNRFCLERSRELHGEPDGSADPDGNFEAKKLCHTQSPTQPPTLPKAPPPIKTSQDVRSNLMHSLPKQNLPILQKKPELPAKPIISSVQTTLKTFATKRQISTTGQNPIANQVQMLSKTQEVLVSDTTPDTKLRKGRAPIPPSETIPKISVDNSQSQNLKTIDAGAKSSESFEKVVKVERDSVKSLPREQNTNNSEATSVETFERPLSIISETFSTSTEEVKTSNDVKDFTGMNLKKTHDNDVALMKNESKGVTSSVNREKEKRERVAINPKFRSLNTFISNRTTVKNLPLLPLTPEPTLKNNKQRNLSMSEEYLAPPGPETTVKSISASRGELSKYTTIATSTAERKSPMTQPKIKTKFSIKKFLRMGGSKTTERLHKKEGTYSEICTDEENSVVGKPRLVIIHPIDLNPTALEVVKDINKTNDIEKNCDKVITSPPSPPQRMPNSQKQLEINKPIRPPPPKSAELRRKQNINADTPLGSNLNSTHYSDSGTGGMKYKTDNVYANLGEIRSSIAPRKPERTASMREREAQLELARKRHKGHEVNENADDTISCCSSNGENDRPKQNKPYANIDEIDQYSPTNQQTDILSQHSNSFQRNRIETKIAKNIEIYENYQKTPIIPEQIPPSSNNHNKTEGRPSSLKDSVRKINNTIDNYLKDKRDGESVYEPVKTTGLDHSLEQRSRPHTASQQRTSLYSDNNSMISVTRSEIAPTHFGNTNNFVSIPRFISASCHDGDVADSEIYSSCNYYGSEAGCDIATDINDGLRDVPLHCMFTDDFSMKQTMKNHKKATSRLRMRKGRSVVHKTIEDNYMAVVVANHEALAQVLDQLLQQTPFGKPALQPLVDALNLRFDDFTIIDDAQAFVVGKKAFHAAFWTNNIPVTLALSADSNQFGGVGSDLSQLSGGVCGVLNPITEFCDLVPSYHLPLMPSTEITLLQATISVWPRLQLETLQSVGAFLKARTQLLDKTNLNFRSSIPNLTNLKDAGGNSVSSMRNVVSVQNLSMLHEGEPLGRMGTMANNNQLPLSGGGMPSFDDVMSRQVAFIMLQLVNGMKNLQVKAIEEMPLSLSNVIFSKDIENKDSQARLCVLQSNNDEDEPLGSLCKCAYYAVTEVLPMTKISMILADILKQERSESLSKSKSVLEFFLWGPSDVVLTGSNKDRELSLQRWLDLERATVLHGLVRTRVELNVFDECHLMFLVRSTAKMINEASKIISSYQQLLNENQ